MVILKQWFDSSRLHLVNESLGFEPGTVYNSVALCLFVCLLDAVELAELAGEPGAPAVGAALPGRAERRIPGKTGEPRGRRPGGGAGQVLLSPETLHQPHHKTEVRGLIAPLCRSTIGSFHDGGERTSRLWLLSHYKCVSSRFLLSKFGTEVKTAYSKDFAQCPHL